MEVEPLQITSCLFSTVVLHAYFLECSSYHHMFLAVTVFSIWFHCTHNSTVAVIDKILAHLAFLMVLLEIPKTLRSGKWYLIAFPFMVLCIWILECIYFEHRFEIHVWLHVVTLLGLHCFLIELHGKGYYYL